MNICRTPKHRRSPATFAASRISTLPGAGQVTVAGRHAYVGHIPNKDRLGTTIIDISDPQHPRVVATITLDDPDSHSHKVARRRRHHDRQPRAQHEPDRPARRAAAGGARARLPHELGREPTPRRSPPR